MQATHSSTLPALSQHGNIMSTGNNTLTPIPSQHLQQQGGMLSDNMLSNSGAEAFTIAGQLAPSQMVIPQPYLTGMSALPPGIV